jgi:hypothetical protein
MGRYLHGYGGGIDGVTYEIQTPGNYLKKAYNIENTANVSNKKYSELSG